MGFRICYLASQADPDQFAQALGLTPVETRKKMPDGEWWVARLKQSGWSILWSEDPQFASVVEKRLAEFSKTHPAYLCEVNETSMWSAASFYRNGSRVWQVSHAGDGPEIYDLNATGALPPEFETLKAQHFATQKADDGSVDHIFEIPLDLAAREIGFRHEDYLRTDDVDAFSVLAPAPSPQPRSFWSRLLGR